MKKVLVRVKGRVQGVGFRYFVRDAAMIHGVTGWVKNNPDGSVSVAASGEEGILRDFLQDLWAKDDPIIRVNAMHTEWHDADNPGEGFEIRR